MKTEVGVSGSPCVALLRRGLGETCLSSFRSSIDGVWSVMTELLEHAVLSQLS